MGRQSAILFWHRLRRSFSSRRPQITLIGNAFESIGRSEHLRTIWRSLTAASVRADIYDTHGMAPEPSVLAEMGHCQVETVKRGIRIFHLNGIEIAPALDRIEARQPGFLQEGYNIVAPVWELPRYPAKWARELDRFDEIWVPTAFVEASIRPVVKAPVFRVPNACQPHVETVLEKDHFGIPADSFAVLTLFDVRSYVARKNPQAAIEAFHKLIQARPDSPAWLVIKINYSEYAPHVVDEIMHCVASIAGRVTIINATLSNNETKNLIRCCDCLLSLHRSEGFGRGPAEAMFFGKPVVATGWSGNMDYMNRDVAFPIEFSLRAVREGEYLECEDQFWADPDVDEAAGVLVKIIDQPDLAKSVGIRARAHMMSNFSDAVLGRHYRGRLARIARGESYGSRIDGEAAPTALKSDE
jgi:glycosyltransferase involved in cell wall biosynthesis